MSRLVLGTHPDSVMVRLVEGDGATLVAHAEGQNPWPNPPTLHFARADQTEDPIFELTAVLEAGGFVARWELTAADVEEIRDGSVRRSRPYTRVRLSLPAEGDPDGQTIHAGQVEWASSWKAGGGKTQRVSYTVAGPAGPGVGEHEESEDPHPSAFAEVKEWAVGQFLSASQWVMDVGGIYSAKEARRTDFGDWLFSQRDAMGGPQNSRLFYETDALVSGSQVSLSLVEKLAAEGVAEEDATEVLRMASQVTAHRISLSGPEGVMLLSVDDGFKFYGTDDDGSVAEFTLQGIGFSGPEGTMTLSVDGGVTFVHQWGGTSYTREAIKRWDSGGNQHTVNLPAFLAGATGTMATEDWATSRFAPASHTNTSGAKHAAANISLAAAGSTPAGTVQSGILSLDGRVGGAETGLSGLGNNLFSHLNANGVKHAAGQIGVTPVADTPVTGNVQQSLVGLSSQMTGLQTSLSTHTGAGGSDKHTAAQISTAASTSGTVTIPAGTVQDLVAEVAALKARVAALESA